VTDSVTNTLAYYNTELITTVKCFTTRNRGRRPRLVNHETYGCKKIYFCKQHLTFEAAMLSFLF